METIKPIYTTKRKGNSGRLAYRYGKTFFLPGGTAMSSQLKPLCLFICAAAMATVSAQTLNLRGRVLEKAGMQPVPGATVKLTGSNVSVVTGADGRFTITGSTNLNASHPLYQTSAPYLRGGELFVERGRSVQAREKAFEDGGDGGGQSAQREKAKHALSSPPPSRSVP